jgi:hypothetical protein
MSGAGTSTVLLVTLDNVRFDVTVDVLHPAFSVFGAVSKIVVFEQNGVHQVRRHHPFYVPSCFFFPLSTADDPITPNHNQLIPPLFSPLPLYLSLSLCITLSPSLSPLTSLSPSPTPCCYIPILETYDTRNETIVVA